MQINNEAKSSPPNRLHTPGHRLPCCPSEHQHHQHLCAFAAPLCFLLLQHNRLRAMMQTSEFITWIRFYLISSFAVSVWPCVRVSVLQQEKSQVEAQLKEPPSGNYYPKSIFYFLFFAASIWPCVWRTTPQRVQALAKAQCGPINFCVHEQLRGCALDYRLLEAGRINFTHRFILGAKHRFCYYRRAILGSGRFTAVVFMFLFLFLPLHSL